MDSFLFIHDVEEYLKTVTVHTMTVYLSNTKKSILKSVKLWEKNKDAGEGLILTWIRHVPGNEAFVKQAEAKQRAIHWKDGRKKKRQRQQQSGIQTLVSSYLLAYDID